MRKKEQIKGVEDWCVLNRNKLSSRQIQYCVCMAYNISLEVLKDRHNRKTGAEPRQCATWFLRNLTNLSYAVIADKFNQKTHAGIMKNERRVKDLLDAGDGYLTDKVLKVYDMLKHLL